MRALPFSSTEYLADQSLLPIVWKSYVLPMKSVGGDVGENPIGVLFGEDFPDEFVALPGEAESFHTMVAGVDNIVVPFCPVEHPERRPIFAVRLRLGFFGSP